jgi:TRAP-type uncharacterized transport system fused permease subunit
MMKGVGYRPHVAGAIEAVASNGGQIMPPIMGAAAFVMAEFLAKPYREVALAALVPAMLYYVILYIQIDLEAAKLTQRSGAGATAAACRFLLWRRFILFPCWW